MKRVLKLFITAMAAVSCIGNNPFVKEWETPYGIPDFDAVKEKHYLPAVVVGIAQQQAEIDEIIANQDAPTFENVVVAYEKSGSILARVTGVLFNVSETDATESLQKIVEQVLPMLSEHSNDIFMNPDFFAKVKVLYDDMENLGLNQEQKMVLKKMYNSFVKNGVALEGEAQARMREINKELSSLEFTFGNNLLAENNAFADKFGLSISEYAGAMASTEDRARREEMFKAYASRGNNGNGNDTKEIITRIMALRIEKAKLLGYETPAAFILSDKMAQTPETVDTFLADLMAPAVIKAKGEIADMQLMMDEDIKAGVLPEGSKIEAWDWAYYAEKVRKAKYALDEEQLRPYFKMENVRQGVFNTVTRLWGLQFEKVEDAPVYHPEVEAFKVSDADGSLIGILLTDYYPRSTKRGGAWMNNFVEQEVIDGVDIRPVIVNVGNFAKPTADKPSLLTLDQVGTLFHEFGHALHGLLSKCTYGSVAGTSVARDFVELPSQIMENWAFEPEYLNSFAKHYQTGEAIPMELIEKIVAAKNYLAGYGQVRQLYFGYLDMAWHTLKEVPAMSTLEFEQQTLAPYAVMPAVEGTGFSTSFSHIFSGGYSAGYYSYKWAEVLEADAFSLFKEKGIFNTEVSSSFRENILSKGGTEDADILYRNFRGHDPQPEALMKKLGLTK